jgi:hypothetical protein
MAVGRSRPTWRKERVIATALQIYALVYVFNGYAAALRS